jgi:hypothetical protein
MTNAAIGARMLMANEVNRPAREAPDARAIGANFIN